MGRRRALSKVESAELFARRQLLKREGMTADDIEKLMRKTVNDCLDSFGSVQREHLQMANIPSEAIDMHFSRILLAVIRERRAARKLS